ncbi:MAG: hypothetical protein F9K30_03660 [Dechloromonas sp.]|nr:MAG: hypothetical protein F9K30_03660 [Dechloromonas sp.]
MNSYEMTLWALAAALVCQAFAAGLALESYLWRGQPAARRRTWLVLACGALLLALHHGYTLELALRTGLYDMRQAILGGLAGACFALGTYALRRQQA